jgi:hypothetical protein
MWHHLQPTVCVSDAIPHSNLKKIAILDFVLRIEPSSLVCIEGWILGMELELVDQSLFLFFLFFVLYSGLLYFI